MKKLVHPSRGLGRMLHLVVAAVAAATLAAVAVTASGATAASAADGRITSTIGNWLIGSSGNYVAVEPNAFTDPATAGVEFTFPAPGETGTIEYTHPTTGEVHCLIALDHPEHISLSWYEASRRALLGLTCQNVTTVVDADTGLVGFMAADGPDQGRYLGDESGGKIVDWAQETFFGVEIPALVLLTPEAPVLTPAPECGTEPTVTIPTMAGVEYQQQRSGNTLTVTAVAVDGGALAPEAVTEWTFDLTPTPCEQPEPEPVTPAAPTLVPAPECGTEPRVDIPTVTGVEYEQTRDGDMITVTARPQDGYALAEEAQAEWAFDVSAEECPQTPPTEQPGTEQTEPGTPSPAPRTAEPAPRTRQSALAQTGGAPAASVVWLGALGLLAGGVLLGLRKSPRRG